MVSPPPVHPVYGSVNRPLTLGGADRRLAFVAVIAGGAAFTLFSTVVGALLLTTVLFLGARWATQHDPQIVRIVLRAAAGRRLYDPGKWTHLTVRRRRV